MENKDEKLWQMATERAKFKRTMLMFLVFNLFLWCIWWFTKNENQNELIPWPAWATLGWGIGMLMKYIRVYHSTDETLSQICDRADDKLFDNIIIRGDRHLLHPLFPPERSHHHSLRNRSHNFQLYPLAHLLSATVTL